MSATMDQLLALGGRWAALDVRRMEGGPAAAEAEAVQAGILVALQVLGGAQAMRAFCAQNELGGFDVLARLEIAGGNLPPSMAPDQSAAHGLAPTAPGARGPIDV